ARDGKSGKKSNRQNAAEIIQDHGKSLLNERASISGPRRLFDSKAPVAYVLQTTMQHVRIFHQPKRVILRYSEGSGLYGRAARSFGVPQDDKLCGRMNRYVRYSPSKLRHKRRQREGERRAAVGAFADGGELTAVGVGEPAADRQAQPQAAVMPG